MADYIIQPVSGFTPQIGQLVAMMAYVRETTLRAVEGLRTAELDHEHDAASNSIGALLAHIAAVESSYNVLTFAQRVPNEDEQRRWGAALELGERARREIKGRALQDYVADLQAVREGTLRELAQRNDDWLYALPSWLGATKMNHYFCWFHVFEDELNHRGQIRWLRKRLPKANV